MEQKPGWPAGYFERLRALSHDLPADFKRPESLPDSPHRDAMIAWIAEMQTDGGERGGDAGPAPSE